MPRMIGSTVGELALLLLDPRVLALEDDLVDELTREQRRIAVRLDAHLLEHLAHDQLDVLVVDLDALRLVDLLHLADEVQLGRRVALQREELSRVERSLVQRIARLDHLPLRDEEARPAREAELPRLGQLATGVEGRRRHRDLHRALGVLDVDLAGDVDERRRALRVPRLEDLDDARKPVRDVVSGDAARVEGPHGELRPRLADRLRGDDADRVADLGHAARCEERAVAVPADAPLAAALEHRAHRDRRGFGLLGELLDDLPERAQA